MPEVPWWAQGGIYGAYQYARARRGAAQQGGVFGTPYSQQAGGYVPPVVRTRAPTRQLMTAPRAPQATTAAPAPATTTAKPAAIGPSAWGQTQLTSMANWLNAIDARINDPNISDVEAERIYNTQYVPALETYTRAAAAIQGGAAAVPVPTGTPAREMGTAPQGTAGGGTATPGTQGGGTQQKSPYAPPASPYAEPKYNYGGWVNDIVPGMTADQYNTWYQQFQAQHPIYGGEVRPVYPNAIMGGTPPVGKPSGYATPEQYYAQTGEGIGEALADLDWSQRFLSETGHAPTDWDWQVHWYAKNRLPLPPGMGGGGEPEKPKQQAQGWAPPVVYWR